MPVDNSDCYPWVWTCEENQPSNSGQIYYIHPDGRQTPPEYYIIGNTKSWILANCRARRKLVAV